MKSLCVVLVLVIAGLFSLNQNTPVEARTQPPVFENYDIRDDATAVLLLCGMDRGRPRTHDPKLNVEYNDTLDVAEVISPNKPLTKDANTRADALKNFVASNRDVFGIASLDQLRLTADYRNPDGNLAFVRFEQYINDIPVFGAELKGGFTKRDELFRVINTLAPDFNQVSDDFGNVDDAIIAASHHVGLDPGIENPTAERFYFPIGNHVAVPAWRVQVDTPDGGMYYVVVDSKGTLLWRKNLVSHQTVPATYNVYGNSTSLLKTADSPSPFSPGCNSPIGCAQPPAAPRTDFTLIGNEAPYTFNNLGWIPDTGLPVRTPADPNITDGNNVEAGIDRDGVQGVDPNGWAIGVPERNFVYAYNPAPGIPPPGDEPLSSTLFQRGSVTHGFYLINRWHDEMYRFGFTEQAGNFQHFNFGRGGTEGDRISFEIQDSTGTNSANLALPADGNRPRLQMYLWTGPTPDRDGALDSQTVLHEITHGVSGRLIGNTTGLSSNMSRGMGEGWSDFYPLALLSEPFDAPLGTHAISAYVSYLVTPTYDSNYYYGFRRFPIAVLRSLGPNGLPHNPLTFRYLNSNCDTFIGTTVTSVSSAYPRNPVFSTSSGAQPCDQIHNLGEVWAVTLWEVRDQLIQRRFPAEGNRRVLQYVTDGMKLSPLNPTMIQMRDSILAAAAATDANDLPAMWRGFAIRGMGFNASVINPGTGANNTVVTESFLMPPQYRRPARADFDGDARTDVSVFRPSDRVWYLNRSTAGFSAITWGLATDVPVPDDYDGDGKADIAIFRANTDGTQPDYYILRSSDSTGLYISWGTVGDIPLSEDYDGDNKADQAVFRPSTAQYWVRRSSDATSMMSGPMTGAPLTMDYDGDGRADYVTFLNGTWRIVGNGAGSSFSIIIGDFGMTGDKPVPADYDGDGRDDLAVYRPSDGTWYIARSTGGIIAVRWGIATDIPSPGDYDGDSRADLAVYRDGVWYVNQSTSGILITSFGLAGDKPLPASYYP